MYLIGRQYARMMGRASFQKIMMSCCLGAGTPFPSSRLIGGGCERKCMARPTCLPALRGCLLECWLATRAGRSFEFDELERVGASHSTQIWLCWVLSPKLQSYLDTSPGMEMFMFMNVRMHCLSLGQEIKVSVQLVIWLYPGCCWHTN